MLSGRLTVYLAFLFGALVAAWHPAVAMEPGSTARIARLGGAARVTVGSPVAVAAWGTADEAASTALGVLRAGGHRSPLLVAHQPRDRRHPSWHRGVSRRLSRGVGGQLSLPSDSGSIPTPFLLYSQRLEWHVLPLPLVHGVGGRSAPPRAPPR